ncbi:MAG: helix-turn-helix transcriptional regulator [Actinomycetota bacterium]
MAVKHGLLALLREQPRYGYQLKTTFEAATGGVWPLNVGQVYTTLDRLERDGLVTVDEAEEQKRYTITAAGLGELGEWWDVVLADEPPPRDELLLKILMAVEQGTDQARTVIDHQRSALFGLLQRRRRTTRATAAPSGGSLAAELVADALIVRAEADLRWLDLCETRLTALGTETG